LSFFAVIFSYWRLFCWEGFPLPGLHSEVDELIDVNARLPAD
jgi:hypothetical protein